MEAEPPRAETMTDRIGPPGPGTTGLEALRACPHCDALYRLPQIGPKERAYCQRCSALLIAPRMQAVSRIVALSLAGLILMVGAVIWPFLDLSAEGRLAQGTIPDAVRAFASGRMFPLSFAVAGFIVVIPAVRLALLIYVTLPMLRGGPPWPNAGEAFRLAEKLRPWSMAEVFLIGVAVALVKIAALATVELGPAFWSFCGLVIVTVMQDLSIDHETIWQAIEARDRDRARGEARADGLPVEDGARSGSPRGDGAHTA